MQLTATASAAAINDQAPHGIPPSDQQIVMSEVWASIILQCINIFLERLLYCQETGESCKTGYKLETWYIFTLSNGH